MKWQLAGAFLALGISPLMAQDEFIAPRSPDREIVEEPIDPVDTSRPSIEGIVAEIFKKKHPLQLINPLAPKRFGNGEKSTSWSDNEPGKPKGFIFFGIEW